MSLSFKVLSKMLQGSPTYNLAQHLAHILKPLVGNTSHNVFHSPTFHLDDSDIFVSFDVISLFTNVPNDETCAIVKIKLLADNQLASCIRVFQLMRLILLNCSSSAFHQHASNRGTRSMNKLMALQWAHLSLQF